jgi:hypothetical protein
MRDMGEVRVDRGCQGWLKVIRLLCRGRVLFISKLPTSLKILPVSHAREEGGGSDAGF